MGTNTKYLFTGPPTEAGQDAKTSDIARSYLNFPGMIKNTVTSFYYFSFVVISDDSEMYTVTFDLPLGQAPSSC